MIFFTEFEERENKNRYCTAQEIDARQCAELSSVLDQWEAGSLQPWDVLKDACLITGARAPITSTYSFYHKPERRKNDDAEKDFRKGLENIKAALRPEVMDRKAHGAVITENIRNIREKLISGEFDSWATAIAIAEVLLIPPPEGEVPRPRKKREPVARSSDDDDFFDVSSFDLDEENDHFDFATGTRKEPKPTHPLNQIKEEIAEEKEVAEAQKKDIPATLALLKPETEASIRQPLARHFALQSRRLAAREKWVKQQEAEYEAEHGVSLQELRDAEKAENAAAFKEHRKGYEPWVKAQEAKGKVVNNWDRLMYIAGAPRKVNAHPHLQGVAEKIRYGFYIPDYESLPEGDLPFEPPINYPGRVLCSEMEIVPSGTGLIEVYPHSKYDEASDRAIYGVPMARITTYSVSFIPKNPEDLEALKITVQQALDALASTPYKYELSDTLMMDGVYQRVTPSGNTPERYEKKEARFYLSDDQGRIQPTARLDLDDLWVLYYLLEPVLEPNAQIAAAMNAARYAEERGAILPPDSSLLGGGSREASDQPGYLKGKKPEQVLPQALRDMLSSLALNQIDEAQFSMQLLVLAYHTLTGQMVDADGKYLSFPLLLAEAESGQGKVLTFEAAMKMRGKELLRDTLRMPENSSVPLPQAFQAAIKEIAIPLRRREQARDKKERLEGDALFEAQMAAIEKVSMADLFKPPAEGGPRIPRREKRHHNDDADAANPKHKNAMTIASNLVVSDSKVETCLDGIHAGGRYISRTRGSPFVRKELPAALQPFCAQDPFRPPVQALLSGPESVLDL